MSEQPDILEQPNGEPESPDEAVIRNDEPAGGTTNPHVLALSDSIGPRPAGSSAEAEAASYLVDAFAAEGLPAARLKTRVHAIGYRLDLILAAVTLIAIAIALLVPIVGLLAISVVLVLLVSDAQGIIRLDRYMPATDSLNVLGIIPPADEEVRRVVVTATLDTGKVGMLASRHLGHLYSWLQMTVILSALVAGLVAIVAVVDGGTTVRWFLLLPLLVTLIAVGLLADREFRNVHSPGAISNASGVAALIETARIISAEAPRWLEVWLLGVGASAGRGGGMVDFLARNTFDPDTTYFVHLVSPGGGKVAIPRSVGAGFRSAPAAPLLAWIFDSIETESDNPPAEKRSALVVDSIAPVTHRAGYQTIAIAGVEEQLRIPWLSGDQDLPYHVVDTGIDDAARLVHLAITAMDREVAARAMLARATPAAEPILPDSPNANASMPDERL